VPHVLPVLVEEQHRAKQISKLCFHNEHQLLQYFVKRGVAGNHLQNTALSVTQRLRPLALGNINSSTHDLKKIARWAEYRVPYCVDISDFAIGMKDPVVHGSATQPL
jgi:hypothetical protein